MPTLKDSLCSPQNRPQVIRDASQLVDDEVKSKGGLTGLAVKAAYAMVTKVKPGLVPEVVGGLLDRFVERMEPFYAAWLAAGKTPSLEVFLTQQKNEVANALLSVTDDRAKAVDNATLRKAYQSLRPTGEKHVEAAVPGLARVVTRHVGNA